jgi:hypothetical protein
MVGHRNLRYAASLRGQERLRARTAQEYFDFILSSQGRSYYTDPERADRVNREVPTQTNNLLTKSERA